MIYQFSVVQKKNVNKKVFLCQEDFPYYTNAINDTIYEVPNLRYLFKYSLKENIQENEEKT